MKEPIYIEKYRIYDLFHNDEKKIVIIMPSPNNDKEECEIYKLEEGKEKGFKLHKCGHGHTYVYILEEEREYENKIKLKINGKEIETRVNKYPCYEDKILMSTMVYKEDKYIRQWINYHKRLGVEHFIIYDNANMNDNLSYKSVGKETNLSELLKDLIKEGIVLLINWPYKKRESREKISGQACQQNHSINGFKRSKYIGLFDIDEYVNMQKDNNINKLIDGIIKEEKLKTEDIGSFVLKMKPFLNVKEKREDGYEFLKIFTCGKVIDSTSKRCKNFIIPKNVNNYCVHTITNGKDNYGIKKETAYFNHYLFLNKGKELKSIRNKDMFNTIMKGEFDKDDNTILRHTKGLF
jgi:hypothetical protein